MKVTAFLATFLLSGAVSARVFTLWEDINYGGAGWQETRLDDSACWNLNGKGDSASSVTGFIGCTTFYRERDCSGASWKNWGNAKTVPDFLNDHIWSFRNQC
ncbi:hypothetical protein TWF694_007149 [Orbilia ellipsospora]|uniref:Uncharacterized protein n=1 Tax=Orbilia ellipsospora TaxID=2528407 RepID=A0AAV9XGX4_9PEZI